jgi:hypothetical protein
MPCSSSAWAAFPACRTARRACCGWWSIRSTRPGQRATGRPRSFIRPGPRPRPRRSPSPAPGTGVRSAGPGFDSMWTDMSEIVRPTRDGIHGREYISTAVDIGRKPAYLIFERGMGILPMRYHRSVSKGQALALPHGRATPHDYGRLQGHFRLHTRQSSFSCLSIQMPLILDLPRRAIRCPNWAPPCARPPFARISLPWRVPPIGRSMGRTPIVCCPTRRSV